MQFNLTFQAVLRDGYCPGPVLSCGLEAQRPRLGPPSSPELLGARLRGTVGSAPNAVTAAMSLGDRRCPAPFRPCGAPLGEPAQELVRNTDPWASAKSQPSECGPGTCTPNRFGAGSWLIILRGIKIWIRNFCGVDPWKTASMRFSWDVMSDLKLHSAWEKKNQVIL